MVCSESGFLFEPGLDRAFDMRRILGSHFGDTPTAFDASMSKGASSTASLHPAASESHVEDKSRSPQILLTLCVFTCYWGVDDTPVVVGLRPADTSGPDLKGQKRSKKSDGADAKALQKQVRDLKVGFIAMK